MQYEAYINSAHVQGWYPVAIERIKDQSKIPEYIEKGILKIAGESIPSSEAEENELWWEAYNIIAFEIAKGEKSESEITERVKQSFTIKRRKR